MTVGFGRKVGDNELRLRDEVKSYYGQVAAAFAAGNEQSLAALFDPGIAKPMTQDQIRDWGKKFFAENGPAAFKVEKLEFEGLGHVEGVVLLTYRVETRDGKNSFGGVERDRLVKRGRRWFVASWEKVSP